MTPHAISDNLTDVSMWEAEPPKDQPTPSQHKTSMEQIR